MDTSSLTLLANTVELKVSQDAAREVADKIREKMSISYICFGKLRHSPTSLFQTVNYRPSKDNLPSLYPKTRRNRLRHPSFAIAILEKFFMINPTIPVPVKLRRKAALELQGAMTRKQINVWCQNRRTKWRKCQNTLQEK